MDDSREKIIQEIQKETWDLIVIGGGITGAGIMREAVRQGLKTLLVEQRDFAWGSSSRSGQLVHGGLRYLKQLNFQLTYKSVRERERMLEELPGLVESFDLMMAIYRESWIQKLIIRSGLLVYDMMRLRFKKHWYSPSKVIKQVAGLRKKDLSCGFLFNESLTDDARLVFRVIQQAVEEGGTALNYCRVSRLLKENGRVNGAALEDANSSVQMEVRARQVINATGAWSDTLRKQVKKTNDKKIRPLRGSHLVISAEKMPIRSSVIMVHPESKRPGFAIPWEGRVLIGDTDIDHKENLEIEAAASTDEVEYMLENIRFHFPGLHIDKNDIISTFAGIRPVVDSGKVNPSEESRDHVIWQEDGLLTVTGGKLTTFRLIALDALKKAQTALGKLPELDRNQPFFSLVDTKPDVKNKMDSSTLKRLRGRFGSQAAALVKAAQPGELELIPGTETAWVELRWAAREEAVVHLEDLMLRRTRIALLLEQGGKKFLLEIRKICQPELGWSDKRWAREEAAYLQIWQQFYRIPL